MLSTVVFNLLLLLHAKNLAMDLLHLGLFAGAAAKSVLQ